MTLGDGLFWAALIYVGLPLAFLVLIGIIFVIGSLIVWLADSRKHGKHGKR